MPNRSQRGFTLVELVIAITLGAIVMSFAAMFIVGPVEAYGAQNRRAAMVDSADAILRYMSRDVRQALPNSVRITSSGGVMALELLLTDGAARYRDDDAAAADELSFDVADGEFTTLGHFGNIDSDVKYLSIYNVGIPGADAYEGTNVITPPDRKITITADGAGRDRVTVSPGMQFAYGSPERRVYIVSGPVTYLCDTNTNTVRRYFGYGINSVQPTTAADMVDVSSSGLVANNVSACNFVYAAGAAQRAGLVTLDVTVEDADATSEERVRLLYQVHVENAP